MQTIKIVVADAISEQGVELLRAKKWDVVLPKKNEVGGTLADADALIVRSATRVTAELLESAPKLRVVGRAGVGVDNIDLDAATRRGVLVMNTPGGNAVSVAEHAFALMAALARKIPQLNAAIHAGRWEKSAGVGTELRGKTLGLIGFGRVGSEVAVRAQALEMRVLAFDPYVSEAVARDAQVELVQMERLLGESDYISLHTALSAATAKLINEKTLGMCKRGAALINTARGELVDETALAEALRSGKLSGAALDVFAEEPPKNSPLIGMPSVIATPHVAGSTREAQEEVGTLIAEQVRDFLAEGALRNAVNLPSLTGEQFRRVRPWIELAERLGSFLAQIATGPVEAASFTFAGEPAELGSSVLRNAGIAGLLNHALAEKVNLVNASQVAKARGLAIEERTRRRERGYTNRMEIAVRTAGGQRVTADAALLRDAEPWILSVDGIELEAALAGTMLFFRNKDVPGVVGQVGTALGSREINISTFALGRRMDAQHGADAVALVRLDGNVPDSIVDAIRALPAVTESLLVRLAE